MLLGDRQISCYGRPSTHCFRALPALGPGTPCEKGTWSCISRGSVIRALCKRMPRLSRRYATLRAKGPSLLGTELNEKKRKVSSIHQRLGEATGPMG